MAYYLPLLEMVKSKFLYLAHLAVEKMCRIGKVRFFNLIVEKPWLQKFAESAYSELS